MLFFTFFLASYALVSSETGFSFRIHVPPKLHPHIQPPYLYIIFLPPLSGIFPALRDGFSLDSGCWVFVSSADVVASAVPSSSCCSCGGCCRLLYPILCFWCWFSSLLGFSASPPPACSHSRPIYIVLKWGTNIL